MDKLQNRVHLILAVAALGVRIAAQHLGSLDAIRSACMHAHAPRTRRARGLGG